MSRGPGRVPGESRRDHPVTTLPVSSDDAPNIGYQIRGKYPHAVPIPGELAGPVAELLVLGLTSRVRGGEIPVGVHRVLWALQDAADAHHAGEVPDVGSEPAAGVSVVSTATAAALVGSSQRYVRWLLATGRIAGQKVNPRLWLVDRDSLDEWRRGNRGEGERAAG